MKDRMYKDYAIAVTAIILPIAVLITMIYYTKQTELEYLSSHNCSLIHQNPPYETYEYDVSLKIYMTKRHEGKRFYSCDDDEWR